MAIRLPGRPWFRPRGLKLGASPKTWEGWLFLAAYVAGLVVFVQAAGDHYLALAASVGALTFVYGFFAWLKTDGAIYPSRKD
jgi:hypothetical protein